MSFDLDKIIKALEWLLAKATVWTGLALALGALFWAVATTLQLPFFHLPSETHDTLDKAGLRFAIFWAMLAIVTLIIELRKSRRQQVAIAAEQIRLNPNIPDASVVPAVQKEIAKQIIEAPANTPEPKP